MTTLFFILTVFFIMYEIHTILNPKKTLKYLVKLSNNSWTSDSSEVANGCLFIVFLISYLIWSIIGLSISTQWYSFLALVALSFVTSLLNRLTGSLNGKSIIRVIDGIISVLILSFIFINHFHPELGVKEWLLTLI